MNCLPSSKFLKGLGIGVEEIGINKSTNFGHVFPGSLPPQKVQRSWQLVK